MELRKLRPLSQGKTPKLQGPTLSFVSRMGGSLRGLHTLKNFNFDFLSVGIWEKPVESSCPRVAGALPPAC